MRVRVCESYELDPEQVKALDALAMAKGFASACKSRAARQRWCIRRLLIDAMRTTIASAVDVVTNGGRDPL